MSTSHTAYLSLGSNLGEKSTNLKKALKALTQHPSISLIAQSSFYKTEPVGYKDQDWFYNAVACIKTTLVPHQLLKTCQAIEHSLGRERTLRWGPRIIDIDLLLYDNLSIQDSVITLPHPEMLNRAFVMIPLLELAPNLKFEGKKQPWKEDISQVNLLNE